MGNPSHIRYVLIAIGKEATGAAGAVAAPGGGEGFVCGSTGIGSKGETGAGFASGIIWGIGPEFMQRGVRLRFDLFLKINSPFWPQNLALSSVGEFRSKNKPKTRRFAPKEKEQTMKNQRILTKVIPRPVRFGNMTKNLAKTIVTSLCALSISVVAVHAQNYDNSAISQPIGDFGYPNTATYGQTFTAPNNYLDDWTFYLLDFGETAQNFKFFVMAWNGAEATGPVLYQSAVQTIFPPGNSWTAFTVNPNLSLTVGNSYVMFINESGLNVGINGNIQLGGNTTSPLGGAFEFLDNGDTFSQVTTAPWNEYFVPYTAYTADFSTTPVPEPSALGLLAVGVTAFLVRRRRKH